MDAIGIGLLIARLIVGLGFMVHGAQKLFGLFGGHGPKGTGQFFEGVGFRPGVIFAVSAGLAEFGGGLLTVLGFLGVVGPALIIMVMLVAIFTIHIKNGFLATNNGWELPGAYIAIALVFAMIGFGTYSIDTAIGFTALSGGTTAWIAVGVAVVLAALNLVVRRPQPQLSGP